MTSVLHLVQGVSFGGACRALIAAGKYSRQFGSYSHSVMSISPSHTDSRAEEFAEQEGVKVLKPTSIEEMKAAIEHADIVQVNWWNNPEINTFLREHLPPCRLLAWFHVGGHLAPQYIPPELVDFVDFAVACSPYTFESPAFRSLSPDERQRRTDMIYGPADFQRLSGLIRVPHQTFNVGYIGTIHFLKMHPRFAEMSAGINVPNIRFVLCGGGGAEEAILARARELSAVSKFDFRGYVDDIRSVLGELDVYGYPLCEDTYAASEINLQEVMYAGIPPVVFPYGGIRRLVFHEFTGMVVHSQREYQEAIEHLYHHPAERIRMGENARDYARALFGAEDAARRLNAVYEKILLEPKGPHVWKNESGSTIELPGVKEFLTPGARLFIEFLGPQSTPFLTSAIGSSIEEVLSAEEQISELSELMRKGGLSPYFQMYPNDRWLALWLGLGELRSGCSSQALDLFATAVNNGGAHWRFFVYLARAAARAGRDDMFQDIHQALASQAPEAVSYLNSSWSA
jgi:glycosyltransferase involved in cell wall biosynthesis